MITIQLTHGEAILIFITLITGIISYIAIYSRKADNKELQQAIETQKEFVTITKENNKQIDYSKSTLDKLIDKQFNTDIEIVNLKNEINNLKSKNQ